MYLFEMNEWMNEYTGEFAEKCLFPWALSGSVHKSPWTSFFIPTMGLTPSARARSGRQLWVSSWGIPPAFLACILPKAGTSGSQMGGFPLTSCMPLLSASSPLSSLRVILYLVWCQDFSRINSKLLNLKCFLSPRPCFSCLPCLRQWMQLNKWMGGDGV